MRPEKEPDIPQGTRFVHHVTFEKFDVLLEASLSRPLTDEHEHPHLFHSLYHKTNSVLSLCADEKYIYSGSQGDDILVCLICKLLPRRSSNGCQVWDKSSFSLKTTLRGHTGSVLALEHAPERKWLFSASGV